MDLDKSLGFCTGMGANLAGIQLCENIISNHKGLSPVKQAHLVSQANSVNLAKSSFLRRKIRPRSEMPPSADQHMDLHASKKIIGCFHTEVVTTVERPVSVIFKGILSVMSTCSCSLREIIGAKNNSSGRKVSFSE